MFFLQSCKKNNPNEDDFVGLWVADNGASVQFMKDKTFIARKIDFSKIYYEKEFEYKKIDFKGKWRLVNYPQKIGTIVLQSESTYSDYGIKHTYLVNGKEKSHKVGFSFEIGGRGLLHKPPWLLFIWIGDPDDMNKYEFNKQ